MTGLLCSLWLAVSLVALVCASLPDPRGRHGGRE